MPEPAGHHSEGREEEEEEEEEPTAWMFLGSGPD